MRILLVLGAIVLCTNARVLNEGDINFDALRTVEHIPFATYGLPEVDTDKSFEAIPLAPLLPEFISPEFVIDVEDHSPADAYGPPPEAEPFIPAPAAPALPELPTPIRVIEEPFPIYGPPVIEAAPAKAVAEPTPICEQSTDIQQPFAPAPPAPLLPELPTPIQLVTTPIVLPIADAHLPAENYGPPAASTEPLVLAPLAPVLTEIDRIIEEVAPCEQTVTSEPTPERAIGEPAAVYGPPSIVEHPFIPAPPAPALPELPAPIRVVLEAGSVSVQHLFISTTQPPELTHPYPPAVPKVDAPYPPATLTVDAPYPPASTGPYPPAVPKVDAPYPPATLTVDAPYPPASTGPYPPASTGPYPPASTGPYPPAV